MKREETNKIQWICKIRHLTLKLNYSYSIVPTLLVLYDIRNERNKICHTCNAYLTRIVYQFALSRVSMNQCSSTKNGKLIVWRGREWGWWQTINPKYSQNCAVLWCSTGERVRVRVLFCTVWYGITIRIEWNEWYQMKDMNRNERYEINRNRIKCLC